MVSNDIESVTKLVVELEFAISTGEKVVTFSVQGFVAVPALGLKEGWADHW